MNALNHLQDYRIVHIVLPLYGGDTLARDCVLRATDSPHLEAVFLPGELPVNELDVLRSCQISFVVEGQAYVLRATIEAPSPSADRLHMIGFETSVPHQSRAFFRVDTKITLRYSCLGNGKGQDDLEEVRVPANLSGGGIRFPMQKPPPLQEKMNLELLLDGTGEESVRVVGEVVRRSLPSQQRQLVALRFLRMETRILDRIMAYCFAEHRRQLRSRVRILGNTR